MTITSSRSQVAERVDPDTGARERAEYFGDSDQVFGFTHLPASVPLGAVLICSPLYAEFVRNYRREVLLGRCLAERGIAVQRFHYRGCGNSEGDPAKTTFDSMRSDALRALEQLRKASGAAPIGVVGARYGALIAAAVVRQMPGAPLAIWDPVVDASRYFRDILRSGAVARLKQADGERSSSPSLTAELEEKGVADVMGYLVRSTLLEDSEPRTLVAEMGDARSPILVLTLGTDPRRARDSATLSSAWKGWTGLDFVVCGETEPWWFTSGAVVSEEVLTSPIEITDDWISRHILGGGG